MQKAFEKIIEKVKEYYDAVNPYVGNTVTKIVNQVAEECKSTEHVNCSTNEVCEWSKMKNTQGYMRAKQHNNAKPNYKIRAWKFCPYCGKKIKVVE